MSDPQRKEPARQVGRDLQFEPGPSNEAPRSDDNLVISDHNAPANEGPEGDELDELMGESSILASTAFAPNIIEVEGTGHPSTKDKFDDQYAAEMEIMRDLEDW